MPKKNKKEDVTPDSSTDITDSMEAAPPSDQGKESVADDQTTAMQTAVDERGISWENRAKEMERKYAEATEQTNKLLDAVSDMASERLKVNAEPDRSKDLTSQLYEKSEEYGVPKEYTQLQLETMRALLEAQNAQSQPAQMMNLDMMNQMAVDHKVSEDDSLAPYKDEMMGILRQTDARFRNSPQAIEQAAAVVHYKHREDIMKAAEQAARKEAETNATIIGNTNSGTSANASGKGKGLTAEEESALRDINARLPEDMQVTPERYLARQEERKELFKGRK